MLKDLSANVPETPYYGLDPAFGPNARTVLAKRYFIRDDSGKALENESSMVYRVADNIASAERAFGGDEARVEAVRETFYRMISSCEFLPNSPTLMNAGKGEPQQLSACFVLPVEDSIDSIFDAVKHAAIIHKTGGGTGFSFTRLRPKNDIVRSTKGVSSGPVSFMKVFNSATEAIKQGGARRGANMGILSVHHPDILEFIECKADMVSITNFNISVALTESFMEAVERDEDYDLRNPRDGQAVGTLSARMVFDKIVDNAWRNGDPGIVFIDRINRDNPTPALGDIESTNPCGEQPLLPYEACNLGSINLTRFLTLVPAAPNAAGLPQIATDDGVTSVNLQGGTEAYIVDWDALGTCARNSVRFLDNVVEKSNFPLPPIEELVKNGNRKVGLGVMGFADVLFMLGIPYNSDAAVALGEKLMAFIREQAGVASEQLAAERGAFGNYEQSVFADPKHPFYTGKPRRNATVSTIAPTGTISIIAGCSSGIEPLFALCFYRLVMDGEKLVESHPYFEQVAKARGFYSEDMMKRLATGTQLHDMSEIPDDVIRVFVTAHDITPHWHLEHQAAFQRSCENAVSKTVNFTHAATRDDVARVYRLAWSKGCKGVTIYRDGSRSEQVLNVGGAKKDGDQAVAAANIAVEVTANGETAKTGVAVRVGGGSGAGPSIKLKASAPGAGSLHHRVAGRHSTLVHTVNEQVSHFHAINKQELCPDCRTGTLIKEEGCKKCHSCGYSKCG